MLKARGMAHSREMREFLLTDDGIHLGENYIEEIDSANTTGTIKREAAKSAASSRGGNGGRKH